jgi:hypothetical protein
MFVVLIISTTLVLFMFWQNQKCKEVNKKFAILGDVETKYLKCLEDVKNLTTGIENPPPLNISPLRLAPSLNGCQANLAEIEKSIIAGKVNLNNCDATRKEKIKELRKMIELNGKISDTEFNKILKKFNIE